MDYQHATLAQAERVVLRNFDFAMHEGEFVYLLGKVGSGKSTLLQSLYAEIRVQEARRAQVLDFDMLALRRRDVPQLRRRLGIVFQDFKLLQELSAEENLDFVLRATGWHGRAERKQRIAEVLGLVGLPDSGYKKPHELSGGEQQRIAIARALLNWPRLLVADEPTGNLDPERSMEIMTLLVKINQLGTTVLVVTHEKDLVNKFGKRVITIDQGRTINDSVGGYVGGHIHE